VIDHAIVCFTAGLTDILMELAFGQAPPGDRWRDCSAKLTMLAKALEESTSPTWVNPPARDPHAELELLVDASALLTMDDDSEDEDNPSLSMPLDLASANSFLPSTSSPAGPSPSTSAPSHQVGAAAHGTSQQGPSTSDMATAAQIEHLQRRLKRTRRVLRILKTTHRTSTDFHFIHWISNQVFI
jgi:hypothetical protein